MPTIQHGLTATPEGGAVRATDIDDLIARYARDLADQADLLAMFYDEPRRGNAPVRTTRPRHECGTMKAYRQHLYYGEQTCDRCKKANAEYVASAEKKRRNRSDTDVRQRAKCGTNKAYHQHRYYGEETDQACKKAHSRAESGYAKNRRLRQKGPKEDPAA